MISRALRKHQCTLVERSSGYNEDGDAVKSGTKRTTIYCCIQPEGEGNFVDFMQSGDQVRDFRLMQTQSEIFAGKQGGNTSDVIEYQATSYKVVSVMRYDALERLCHYEVCLKKIKRLA